MPTKNSTDKLKGRRVKKGTPRTKPSAKESARADKVQDKPKSARGTRASSTPASRPGRQSNTGKMEGASGTRNATDKGKTAKKITNSRAAATKRKLKDNKVKQEAMPKNKKPSKLASAASKVARVGSRAAPVVGALAEGVIYANKRADKRSPALKSQVKKASASQKARRAKKKPKA